MKRFLLIVAVLALSGSAADAGPIRNAACAARQAVQDAAERVRERVQARPHVRQFGSDLKAVAAVPSKIAESRPLLNFLRATAGLCGPGGCR